MLYMIIVLLYTFPAPSQYYTIDENASFYVPGNYIVSHDLRDTSDDSLPQMPGWPKTIHAWGVGVCLADVDQNGSLEILVGTRPGSFYVWDYYGNSFPGWPKTGLDSIWSKPAVADIDPSYPGLEIIVVGRVDTAYAWHCDGSTVPGWPCVMGETGGFESPVIFDIDNNGDLEIIIGQRYYPNGRVVILNHDGTMYPGWPQSLNYMCVATPSVADIDADGEIEICAADYCGLFLWDKDGNMEPGWPILNPQWMSSYAQPVLADLDNDGDLEILAPYSYEPPIFTAYVGIYHHDGSNFTNWPQEFPGNNTYTMAVVADIDNDGDFEIFGGGHCYYPMPDLLVRHLNGDTVMGWPVPVGVMECSPIVFDLDLDEDGKREILVNNNEIYPYGDFFAFNDDGTVVPGWPLGSGAAFPNSPSVGDVDADGDIEIAIVAESLVYLYTVGDIQYRPYTVEWGTWFHDNWNTGWFHPKAPQNLQATSSPTSVHLTWIANTEIDIAGYNVYRSEFSGPPYLRINDTLITDTTYDDVPPQSGILYYYCVTAQIKACTESRLSNEVSASIGIQEHSNQEVLSFSVSPTPFADIVCFNISANRPATINIYNSMGTLVDKLEGQGTIQWRPMQQLPIGIYFAEMMIAKKRIVKKIIRLK